MRTKYITIKARREKLLAQFKKVRWHKATHFKLFMIELMYSFVVVLFCFVFVILFFYLVLVLFVFCLFVLFCFCFVFVCLLISFWLIVCTEFKKSERYRIVYIQSFRVPPSRFF